jgi:hypothetical protein
MRFGFRQGLVMSLEYFEMVAVGVLIYCIFRALHWLDLRRRDRPAADTDWTGKPLDAPTLANRLRQVRQDYPAEIQSRPPSLNRPLLIERKRQELATLAFFHKPPPPEPAEEEHRPTSLLA